MIDYIIENHGEVFEVTRNGQLHTAKGAPNTERAGRHRRYIGFYPDADVIAGDEIRGTVSGNQHIVSGVERQLMEGRPLQLKAYIDEPHHAPSPGAIHVGSMVNSTIQQGSPGAVQHVVITQQQHEAASDLVRAVSDLVGRLDVPADQREELETEVETINTVLSSPAPKPSILRRCFGRVKAALGHAAGLATSAAANTATREVIGRIEHYLSQWGG